MSIRLLSFYVGRRTAVPKDGLAHRVERRSDASGLSAIVTASVQWLLFAAEGGLGQG
jgi:hypothetical protein